MFLGSAIVIVEVVLSAMIGAYLQHGGPQSGRTARRAPAGLPRPDAG